MGARAYPLIENYARSVTASIIEIGGERGEGSTSFLRAFAERKSIPFHTVDMVNTGMTGEDWLRQVFPAKRERVSFAYLDNFDWTYESIRNEPWLLKQIDDYAKAGVVMNNDNSMAVHLEQTQLLEPFAAEDCAILFDDTWPLPGGRWTGKGGRRSPGCWPAAGVFWSLSHPVRKRSRGTYSSRGAIGQSAPSSASRRCGLGRPEIRPAISRRSLWPPRIACARARRWSSTAWGATAGHHQAIARRRRTGGVYRRCV